MRAPDRDRDHDHDHDWDHDWDRSRWLEPEPWDERYREPVWSGRVNRVLAAETAGLEPGSALDVGCGEGADALWLARRGWRVTAVDFSAVGLARAAGHAADAGPEVAARIAWERVDVRRWSPPAGSFDLVTSHFLHLAGAEMTALVARLAAAVRPGGRLLVVGHDPTTHSGPSQPGLPDLMLTAGQLAAPLGTGWEVLAAEARPRRMTGPDGEELTIADAVVHARRAT